MHFLAACFVVFIIKNKTGLLKTCCWMASVTFCKSCNRRTLDLSLRDLNVTEGRIFEFVMFKKQDLWRMTACID